jgi:hypothetical protein
MTSVRVGERVRLRAVEPEDWESFQNFDVVLFGMTAAEFTARRPFPGEI